MALSVQALKTVRRFTVGTSLLFAVAIAAKVSLETAHKDLLADNAFDFEYVEKTPPKPKPKTAEAADSVLGAIFDFIGPILSYVFWAFVIALVGWILFHILKEAVLIKRQKTVKAVEEDAPVPVPAYQPSAQNANILLADVDALAAQGKYAQAVHTLLLRSISDIRKNRPRAVPRDLTSREISTLAILSEESQLAFKGISTRVERSHFGGQPLSKEDFVLSRAAYTSFAFDNPANAARKRRRK